VVGIAHGEKKYIGTEIPLSTIPAAPTNLIGFIDGCGNFKTTMRQSQNQFPPNTKVKISVGAVERQGLWQMRPTVLPIVRSPLRPAQPAATIALWKSGCAAAAPGRFLGNLR
ncbi:MAG: hypothetical protein ACOY0S_03775, partial [Patescibacteria group bacterium]